MAQLVKNDIFEDFSIPHFRNYCAVYPGSRPQTAPSQGHGNVRRAAFRNLTARCTSTPSTSETRRPASETCVGFKIGTGADFHLYRISMFNVTTHQMFPPTKASKLSRVTHVHVATGYAFLNASGQRALSPRPHLNSYARSPSSADSSTQSISACAVLRQK